MYIYTEKLVNAVSQVTKRIVTSQNVTEMSAKDKINIPYYSTASFLRYK